MTESSSLSKLVRFASFPEVVTLAPLSELKARLRALEQAGAARGPSASRDIGERVPSSPKSTGTHVQAELRGLLELYFIDAPQNRRAWEAVIGSMAHAQGPGRGFLISGAYGSGKSHMLAALSLLAEHVAAWDPFTRGHPWMRRFARAFGPARRLLAVEIPLDHYRGGSHALEAVVLRHLEDELRRRLGDAAPALVDETAYLDAFDKLILPQRSEAFRGFLAERDEQREWGGLVAADRAAAVRLAQGFMRSQGLELALDRPRAETLARVREALRSAGYRGLVLLIDELSLFLAAKDKRGLDEDAAFLQFLGQQAGTAARPGAPVLPLWIIAATQRELEEVGDIDSHSLRQIRDRYESHHLSLAQLRTVIERKLVEKPNPRAFAAAVAAACESWAGDGGQLSFAPDELTRTYPFNPLALEAFQGAAESFLSQTRSVVQTVGRAAASGMLAERADALLSADAVFDLAAERLAGRPELARFEAARRFYAENAERISRAEPKLVAAIFRALALAALGSQRWTVREIADALAGSALRGNNGAEFYLRVHAALKAMRRRGAYIECVPQADDLGDQYYLELSSDVGEAMRRRLYEVMDALGEGDSRVFEHAAAACEQGPIPLAQFATPRPQQFEWMNTVRRATVERRDLRRLRPEDLSRLRDALGAAGTPESAWLAIGDMCDAEGQRAAWLEVAGQVAGRWSKGLLAWLPRRLAEDELEVLREHAALRMLAADPTTRAGEHGRQVAARVAQRLSAQAAEAARIVSEAYTEGEVVRGDGRHSDLARLASGDQWEDVLGGILDWPLRDLYPKFRELAPRKRLAGKQRSTFVIEGFLRPGSAGPPPDSPLEEAVVAYVEPLRLAQREGSQWRLAVSESAAAQAVLALVPTRTSGDALDAASVVRFADCCSAIEKSEWGLTAEMMEIVIGALARTGHVLALDGFLNPIPFARVGTPLSDHVTYLARALPLSPQDEERALALAQALFQEAPERLDCETQNDLWARVCAWAQEASARLPELEQRLASLYGTLGQGPAEWAESRRALAAAHELTNAIDTGADCREGLTRAAEVGAQHAAPLQNLHPLAEFVQHDADLVALMFRYLNDARLQTPEPEAARLREELLQMVAGGEAIISVRAAFRHKAEAFISRYGAAYQQHHANVYGVARFRAYADLRRQPEFQALAALTPLGLARDECAAAEANLRAQMERHCAGGRVADALRRQPVCPDCGLVLGEDIRLIPPRELLADARSALAGVLVELSQGGGRIEEALAVEGDSRKAQAVRRALEVAADAPADAVLAAFSPPVVEWIAAALRERAGKRLRLAELQAFLHGKRLTREQALRAFAEWLAAHGAAKDEDPVEFE